MRCAVCALLQPEARFVFGHELNVSFGFEARGDFAARSFGRLAYRARTRTPCGAQNNPSFTATPSAGPLRSLERSPFLPVSET